MNDEVLTNYAVRPDEYEAAMVILKHERIKFTTGVGPTTYIISIAVEDHPKVAKALKEWASAVTALQRYICAI